MQLIAGMQAAPASWLRLRLAGHTNPEELVKRMEAQERSGRVNLDVVVQKLGIHLRRDPTLGYDGHCIFSLEDGGQAEIAYDPSTAPVRQRFTIAHEIGHIMLHPPGKLYRDIVQLAPSNSIEAAANRFAAALLMPSADMHEFLRHRVAEGLSMGSLAGRVADLYEVSVRAAEIRLDNLTHR